jgi:hypothetical protein
MVMEAFPDADLESLESSIKHLIISGLGLAGNFA